MKSHAQILVGKLRRGEILGALINADIAEEVENVAIQENTNISFRPYKANYCYISHKFDDPCHDFNKANARHESQHFARTKKRGHSKRLSKLYPHYCDYIRIKSQLESHGYLVKESANEVDVYEVVK